MYIDKEKRLSVAMNRLSGKARCVAVNDTGVHVSEKKGIAPMIDWLEEDREFLRGASVADKVVGRAAAMLMVYAGVAEVYASVVSNGALALLTEKGIACRYSNTTLAISNRRGDGICPMEKTVAPIKDPEKAYEALREKLRSMNN